MAREVLCATVDRESPYDDYRSITEIGYDVGDLRFTKTPERMYEKVEEKNQDFYVENGNDRAYLEGVEEDDGTKYVRTEADSTTENNLLSLEGC